DLEVPVNNHHNTFADFSIENMQLDSRINQDGTVQDKDALDGGYAYPPDRRRPKKSRAPTTVPIKGKKTKLDAETIRQRAVKENKRRTKVKKNKSTKSWGKKM
ncbi:hypothetical protein KIPB_008538, partial [Kipferlia bialata]